MGLRYKKPVKRITVKISKETEGSKTATVKIDEEQMRIITELLNELRISVDDVSVEPQTQNSDDADFHAPSILMKTALGTFFVMIAVALILGLIKSWNAIIVANNLFTAIVAAVILGVIALTSIVIGCSIGTEQSKTYIVSLFSAVVALAALSVALFK